MGFSIQKLDHVGQLSLAAGALSINLTLKNSHPFVENKRGEKPLSTIKIVFNMLQHSPSVKRKVWHAPHNPAQLFDFDCTSYNDILVLTRLRNKAATEGGKGR